MLHPPLQFMPSDLLREPLIFISVALTPPFTAAAAAAAAQRTDTAMELLLGHPNARLSRGENKSRHGAILQSQAKFQGTFI